MLLHSSGECAQRMAEYRLAPAAERDLENIWLYTWQQWGPEQADRYIDTLTGAFTELAQAPLSFPACDTIRPGYRRRTVERHTVYYRVADYGVAIIRILHHRMDAPRNL